MPQTPRYLDGILDIPYEITQEEFNERKINNFLDNVVDQLRVWHDTLRDQQTALTALQQRQLFLILVKSVSGMLRIIKRRFDETEE